MMSNMLQYHPHYYQEEFRCPQHRICHEAIQTKVDGVSRSSAFLSTTPQTDIPCFDRCEVEVGPHVLGQGAFSQVHAVARLHLKPGGQTGAKSTVHGRKHSLAEQIACQGRSHYAMKHLRGDLMGNKEDFESAAIDLCIEVKFLTRLNHPNIVKVRGLANGWTSAFADRHDGFFIIMDRMEPLDHRIHRWRDRLYRYPERGQVGLARKIVYASQIADAISYLHDHRIIFRDLKPSNVGFTSEDNAQVFDFGLCREIPQRALHKEDETFLMSGVGTRRYQAPEVLNSNCYNLKADCYSWAMTFVEMLTLDKPYPQYSSEQYLQYVCKQGERPILSHMDLPPVLQTLLEQAWAHDVRMRLSMKAICLQMKSLSDYTDDELSRLTCCPSNSTHTIKTHSDMPSITTKESPVVFEFPPHFQHLLQDCEILSEYSDMDNSCMDLTLTTTASTTWQDSVSTFFS